MLPSFSTAQVNRLWTYGLALIIALTAAAADSTDRIDQLVQKRLASLDQELYPRAADAVLLRRLYLQIIGRNPTVHEFEDYMEMHPDGESSFAGLSPAQKKEKLIDQLLASREYAMHEFNY